MKPNQALRVRNLFLPLLLSIAGMAGAQNYNFALKSTPEIDFTFNTIEKCVTGIIIPRALTLNVQAPGEWDLYIGTVTTTAGAWNVTTYYSTSGPPSVPVGIIQARVYNTASTQTSGSGFFPLTDILTPTYIIGSSLNDPLINCSDPNPAGTNAPGDYSSDPGCYRFNVDLRIVPGLNYRPGLYTLRIDYIVIEDL